MAIKSKRGPKPVLRVATLAALQVHEEATAADLGVSTPFLCTLVNSGLVRRAGTVKVTPGKGRPRRQYRLTAKGRRLVPQAA